jgi:hypothetical protein
MTMARDGQAAPKGCIVQQQTLQTIGSGFVSIEQLSQLECVMMSDSSWVE